MKKLFSTILMLCFCMPALASVQSIYTRLLKASGERRLPLYIKKGVLGTCSLACTDGSKIIVSVELLSIVKNDDELAGVIGHEMGHRYYTNEMQADLIGLKWAEKAGYSRCRAAQLMKGYGADAQHPAGMIRYKNTGCR